MIEQIRDMVAVALAARPDAACAYEADPMLRHQVHSLPGLLGIVAGLMQREALPYSAAERVLEGTIGVFLDGYLTEQARRQQELAAMMSVALQVPEELLRPQGAPDEETS